MNKRAKALDIPKRVKDEVWERDNHCCVICGSPYAMPNAHYISRSHGGLGVPENIFTACLACHNHYDNGTGREEIKIFLREYLESKYPGWNEKKLIYRKWSDINA